MVTASAGLMINPAKIIDLTYTFDSATIYWPGEGHFEHQFESHNETPENSFYSAASYAAPEHLGTHADAPIHYIRGGLTLDQVPLASCVGPAAVVDFSDRAAKDRNATLSVDDLERYESAHGRIPDGAIVVAHSGWGKFWPGQKAYMGTDRAGDVAGLRFPGFSLGAANWMLKKRNVAAIAIDTASMDPGISTDFPVHRAWLGAGKPGFENLANMDKMPPKGATIFCIPMKIGKGTGGPTRCFAILP